MRLLVLDDDAAVGRLVSRVARIVGIEAMALTDPSMLPAALRTRTPDLVVLDLQLGPDDGVEQLRLLAERQFTGSLILISGFNQRVLAATRAVAEDLGLRIEATLPKPIGISDLEQVLQRVQAGRQVVTPEQVMAAIRNGELSVALQPIVSRTLKKLHKLEVLVRWEHPTKGVLPAEAFVPAAETQARVLDALTKWVIDATVEAYQVLRDVGIAVPLAINLSVRDLRDPLLPDRLIATMQAGGMPAEHLWLEINQRTPVQDMTEAVQQLARLRLKKMQISFAEFGAGYSPLSLLRRVPFSEVKIDRSLVRDVGESEDARLIVQSIIDLARKMDMETIASGVDTELAATTLEALGVNGLQGRFIAMPMPVETIQSWLARWTAASGEQPHKSRSPANMAKSGLPSVPTTDDDAAQFSEFADSNGTDRRSALSPRQLEVIRLLAEGKSVKEIARSLALSIGTVKVHLSRAYSVLGAHNRIEAIIKAGFMDQASGSGTGTSLH